MILRYFHFVKKNFLHSEEEEEEEEESKCLMKCGNKIEKQKLNEADFVLKFYFLLFSSRFSKRKVFSSEFSSGVAFIFLLCLFDFVFPAFLLPPASIECENLK